jgi:hypothetical protein
MKQASPAPCRRRSTTRLAPGQGTFEGELMKRTTTALVTLAATAAAVFAGVAPASAHGQATDDRAEVRAGHAVGKQLAAVRRATAKYRNVKAAIADGFVQASGCTESPGVGGMGYHYMNMANVADGVLDATKPELLVYVPTEDGLKLAAAEYFQADADQNLATDSDRPSLFGIPFDGPMPGHEPGMPIHYDLHAWVWYHNPSGVFAPWNPRVSCEEV